MRNDRVAAEAAAPVAAAPVAAAFAASAVDAASSVAAAASVAATTAAAAVAAAPVAATTAAAPVAAAAPAVHGLDEPVRRGKPDLAQPVFFESVLRGALQGRRRRQLRPCAHLRLYQLGAPGRCELRDARAAVRLGALQLALEKPLAPQRMRR